MNPMMVLDVASLVSFASDHPVNFSTQNRRYFKTPLILGKGPPKAIEYTLNRLVRGWWMVLQFKKFFCIFWQSSHDLTKSHTSPRTRGHQNRSCSESIVSCTYQWMTSSWKTLIISLRPEISATRTGLFFDLPNSLSIHYTNLKGPWRLMASSSFYKLWSSDPHGWAPILVRRSSRASKRGFPSSSPRVQSISLSSSSFYSPLSRAFRERKSAAKCMIKSNIWLIRIPCIVQNPNSSCSSYSIFSYKKRERRFLYTKRHYFRPHLS